MIYRGKAAIDYLGLQIDSPDPGESSHWIKFNSKFSFAGGVFSGLQGFGCNGPSWQNPLHLLFQRPFRKMASSFSSFKKIDEIAFRVTKSQGRAYDLDVLRQAITVAYLQEKIPEALGPSSMGCVIGDGFASATSILLKSGSAKCVVLINLTKTLMVDLWFFQQWMGDVDFESNVRLVTNDESLKKVLVELALEPSKLAVIAIQAKHHDLVKYCPVDFAINIASMGEMNPSTISEYFEDLRSIAERKNIFFYCANRIRKELPDGTVTSFEEYPWNNDDLIRDDELCPWTQFYYSFAPPFYRLYDGPFQHKLVRLSKGL